MDERPEIILAAAAAVARLPPRALSDLRRGLCAPEGERQFSDLLTLFYRLPSEHRQALLLRLRRLLGPRLS